MVVQFAQFGSEAMYFCIAFVDIEIDADFVVVEIKLSVLEGIQFGILPFEVVDNRI